MDTLRILKKIGLAMIRNNTVLYWLLAAFAMFATYLPFMWAAAPFIGMAILYRAYTLRYGPVTFFTRRQSTVEPGTPATPHSFTFEIPVPPERQEEVKAAASSEVPTNRADIIDPFVNLPDVYRKSISWEQYYEPTWQRKGIDLSKVLIFSPESPKEIPGPIKLLPEFATKSTNPAMPEPPDESGSFIYA